MNFIFIFAISPSNSIFIIENRSIMPVETLSIYYYFKQYSYIFIKIYFIIHYYKCIKSFDY